MGPFCSTEANEMALQRDGSGRMTLQSVFPSVHAKTLVPNRHWWSLIQNEPFLTTIYLKPLSCEATAKTTLGVLAGLTLAKMASFGYFAKGYIKAKIRKMAQLLAQLNYKNKNLVLSNELIKVELPPWKDYKKTKKSQKLTNLTRMMK